MYSLSVSPLSPQEKILGAHLFGSPATERDLSLLQSLHTASGASQRPIPFPPGINRCRCEADHSSPSSAEVINAGLPNMPS
jgi:hypothetical protein